MFEINFSCHDLKISEKHHLKVNNKEYTNHYYIGNQRVVSKLGGGFLMDTVPQFNMMFGFHVLDPHAYNIKKLQDKAMVKRDLMGCGQPGTLQITTGLYNFLSHQPTRSDPEENINYYNGDHLGSTSYITDASGLPSQHVAYIPFGEVLLEEKAGTWLSPYKFNCKELDDESGLYYYGARYYDPKSAVFLGVDPLSDKYPTFSPFAYCMDNPIRLIDPNGKEIETTEDGWKVINYGLTATLRKSNPFSYNKETGKVEFNEKTDLSKLNSKQLEIVDHYKSLVKDKNFTVNVSVVSNETKFLDNSGNETSLGALNATGAEVLQNENLSHVYITDTPLQNKGSGQERSIQKEDIQGITSLHEIGGHSYYHQQKIFGKENNKKTEQFERIARDCYKGKYLPNYI